jgi:putative ABC transport system permease protein
MFLDARYALRSLLKAPGFTAVVVLTLALGIGATTAIFSVVHATLLRPLPYPQVERIVSVRQVDAHGNAMPLFSDPNFQDVRDGSVSFAALAEYSSWMTTATDGPEAMRFTVAMVSKQFFAAMGVQPIRGRSFLPEETRLTGAPVALVSHSYWKSKLQSTREIAGRHVSFDGKAYSIVGVMPAGFRFPAEADLWIPLEQLEQYPERTAHTWQVIGRLKPGVTLQQAQLDVSRVARAVKARFGSDTSMSDAAVILLRDAIVGHAKTVLLFLLAAAGILLLAACANTANLLLAKSASRQQELAVRVALGASRRRLLSQFFTEACLLALAGGVLGVLFAHWCVNALLGVGQRYLTGVTDIAINLPVLAFSLTLSFVTAAGLSALLALRAGRHDFFQNLKQGELRQTGSVRDVRVRAALMTVQVAIATLLLAAAGLLTRSLLRVMDVRPGYRTENILTADIFLTANDSLDFYRRTAGARAERVLRGQLLDEIVRRMSVIPGVDSAGVVRERPLTGTMLTNGTFLLLDDSDGEGTPDWELIKEQMKDPGRTGFAWYQAASTGYFKALHIPLKRGRLFDERDTEDGRHVALISETLARQRWPNQDPLGYRIEFGGMDGDMRVLEIVGVVGDVHNRDLEADPEPVVYVNAVQRAPTYFSLMMHTTTSPIALIPTVRTVLRNVDTKLVPRFQIFQQVVSASLGERQFQLFLLGMFAGGALLLAVLGLYGVTSYMVAERTREIGVRMALGAQVSDVLGLVLRQGVVVVLIGIGVGICAEFALTSLLRGMLYGISAVDPLTLAGVCALLAGLTVFACWIPARRATRVDPLVALRAE